MKLAFAVPLLLTLPLMGCGGGSSGSTFTTDMCQELSSDTFSCTTMLQDITTVTQQTVATLKTDLTQLDTAIATYCSALDANVLPAAKTQFTSTLATVQQLEVMQFDVIDSARDNFYNWPLNDTCKVDLQIATDPNQNITEVATGRRGLNAVEYILFEEDTLASCATSYTAVQNWISENDVTARKNARCSYALEVMADLVDRSILLANELSNQDLAGQPGTLQAAANSISDALFYVDKQTKDAKLINVLPQTGEADFKATSLESQFAHISKEHMQNNLLGARAIFTANDQTGLEDYLIAAGQESLAIEMLAALDAASANLDSIVGDFYTAVSNATDQAACINSTTYAADDSDIIKLCALQKNIKTFTDLLKEDFVMVLKFTKPAAADGDND